MIRTFDFFLSLFFLFLFSPLLILISFLNIIFNKKIFYHSERIGLNGKKIIVKKFITIRDNKFLTFGRFLRRSSLDEIPQLFSVLSGEMSLVGPRPYPIENFKNLSEENFVLRHSIKPGLTGLSQIRFECKKRTLDEKIYLDLKMIKKFNLITYLKILLFTPKVIIIRYLKNKSGDTL